MSTVVRFLAVQRASGKSYYVGSWGHSAIPPLSSADGRSGVEATKGTPRVSSALGDLYLPLEGLIDFDAERGRLGKELQKVDKEIDKVELKLSNPSFAERAPVEVLEEQRQRLSDWQARRGQINEALENLSS